jgi:hypothetical protein
MLGSGKDLRQKLLMPGKNEDYILFNSLKSSSKKLDFTPLCSPPI